jgi:hypothetical protein
MSRTLTDARLMDLVRYARHHLFTEGLITNEEYAALVQHQGAVARLEGYDAAVLAERVECLKLIDAALLIAVERGNPVNNANTFSQLTNYGAAEALRNLRDAIRARGKA